MITSCKNTYITDIQCRLAELALQESNALKIGRPCLEREQNIKVIASYLPLLYCYKTFDATVTYCYRFVFLPFIDTQTVSLTIGTETFTYTGEYLGIKDYFYQQITNNTTYDFQVFSHQGMLYVYSYDNALSFSTQTTSSNEFILVTINMQDSYESLLNIWNCLTSEQICGIINNVYKITGECNCS